VTGHREPPEDAAEIRPEVVQAVFSALTDIDLARLAPLEETGITPAERKQAEALFTASLEASLGHRERTLQAMQILIGERNLSGDPAWPHLFDRLTPERAEQLRDLYDALPDGARAEYDRRYGRPGAV